jgi:hypothetical protein
VVPISLLHPKMRLWTCIPSLWLLGPAFGLPCDKCRKAPIVCQQDLAQCLRAQAAGEGSPPDQLLPSLAWTPGSLRLWIPLIQTQMSLAWGLQADVPHEVEAQGGDSRDRCEDEARARTHP